MNQCNINTLSKRIPQDILREHIMPYTYKKQCSSLLLDIKSFRYDYGLIEDLYCTQFNASICLRDLINFCNNREELIINEETQLIETILRRSYQIIPIIKMLSNPKWRYCKYIIGLLTPSERTQFINMYIIDNE